MREIHAGDRRGSMQFTWLSMRPSASLGCCFGRSGRWYPATALSLQAGPQPCLHPPHYNLALLALGTPWVNFHPSDFTRLVL